MKKLLSIILVAVIIITAATVIAMPASAAATSGTFGDNATWKIENNVLTITGTGDLIDWDFYQPWRDNQGMVHKVVVSEGITGIGLYNFYYLDNLQEVQLPSTLKTIGDSAFCYCRKLNTVTIPDGVESIGKFAFFAANITSITVPDSVTYLGSYCFDNCFVLESVKLSDSLRAINRDMFQSDYALKYVTLPKNLVNICKRAFCGCSSLESITLPETVKSIGDQAFAGCEKLSSINLPEGVKIGTNAFNTTPCLKPVIKITKQPVSTKAAAVGETATVSVTATGDITRYDWYYRNKGEKDWTKSVCHTASYSTVMTSARYGRQVYCNVIDKYNRKVKSKEVTLTFDTGLKITQDLDSVCVENAGDTARLKVVAEGKGKTYTWYYKNPSWKKWSKSTCTSSTYKTAVTSDRYGREVYCIVRDKYGVTVKSDIIRLTYKR